mgnify:CR=1 FL=1
MKIAIIGGGAAGMFAAANIRQFHPDSQVTVFEKKQQLLAKVRVSGGGRCNLSHACRDIAELLTAYPRGATLLKRVFHQFDHQQTMEWFKERGLKLVTQDDGCVFPASQDAMSVVKLLIGQAEKNNVALLPNHTITGIGIKDEGFELTVKDHKKPFAFDKLIITTGGSRSISGLEWLKACGHEIVAPAPSLFTFNVKDKAVTALMGLVVNQVNVSVTGTTFRSEGPLLITHWGFSGPAILKLSAFAARHLFDQHYNFSLRINWTGRHGEEEMKQQLEEISHKDRSKRVTNSRPQGIPQRLWEHLLRKAAVDPDQIWQNLGKKSLNLLANLLCNDQYAVSGKTTFREEFVTSGGISLKSVDMNRLESKVCRGIYFAGELLDIDGITGGYNLQAAWSTGYVAAMLK